MSNSVEIYAIFPVGGVGKRFINNGYDTEKPFIEILNKSQIEWSIFAAKRNFPGCRFIIGCRSGLFEKFLAFKTSLENTTGIALDVINIGDSTSGAASTLSIILKKLIKNNEDFSFISLDNDVAPVINSNFLEIKSSVKLLTTFSKNHEHSFVKSDSNGTVEEIAEKRIISNQGVVGNYYFESAKTFIVEEERTTYIKSEHYISEVINQYLQDGFTVKASKCELVFNYGTPDEIKELSSLTMKNYLTNAK